MTKPLSGMQSALERFKAWVVRLEEIPVGPAGWTAGFLSIVAVRHLLELRSGGYPLYPASGFYVHYVLAYLAPLLCLTIVLAVFSGVPLERVLRLMLLAWGLTLLPPLVDTLVARAHEAKIGYMQLEETPWLSVVVHFFDPAHPLEGTTPGIRLETAAACLLGSVYVLLRAARRRGPRAIGAVACIYLASITFFTLPYLFLRSLRWLNPSLTWSSLYSAVGRVARPENLDVRADQGILIYLAPLTLALGAVALALSRPSRLRGAARDVIASEGWGWLILGGLGALAGWRILKDVPRPVTAVAFDRLALLACPISLLFAGFALALLLPDRESNGRRARDRSSGAPFASGALAAEPLDVDRLSSLAWRRGIGAVLLVHAAILATSASSDVAAFGSIALGAGVLARGIPRILPWAVLAPQFASGMASLAAFIAGFSLAAGGEAITLIPSPLYLLAFMAGFLADLGRDLPEPAARMTPWLRATAASVPLLALVVPVAVLHARATLPWIGVAILFSAAAFAALQAVPVRAAAGSAFLGAAVVLSVSLADPAQVTAWRERALAPPGYWIRLSEKAEDANDLDMAAGAAREAIQRAPRMASGYGRLGRVLYLRGDYPAAVEQLRIAAELSPEDDVVRASLASILLKAGSPAEGLSVAEAGLREDEMHPRSGKPPARPSLHFVRAQCLDALGRRTEADEAWRAYIARAQRDRSEASYVEIARRRLSGLDVPVIVR